MSELLQVDDNIVSVQTIKASKGEEQRLFLMCDDCFWSASAITSRKVDVNVDACPQCGKIVSRLPLSKGEGYTFNYGIGRGVELEFFSKRQ